MTPTSRQRAGKVLSLVVSAAILVALYRGLDWRAVPAVLAASDGPALTLAVLLILPITAGIALRFLWLVPGDLLGAAEALRLTLVAHVLNLFLPAKAGDLAKGYFISRQGVAPAVALSVIVYERTSDLFGLLTWCLVGALLQLTDPLLPRSGLLLVAAGWVAAALLLASEGTARVLLGAAARALPGRLARAVTGLSAGWLALHVELRRRPGRRLGLVVFSLGLWLLHLTQLWLFVRAVGGQLELVTSLPRSSLAILIALVPFTFAGLGVRDVAIVVLFAPWLDAEQAATVGLLTATRAFLPALIALTVVRPYVAIALGEAQAWRAQGAAPPP